MGVSRRGAGTIGVGLVLQPDERYLDALGPLFDRVDYFEVAPETLWRPGPNGDLLPNGFFRRFAALRVRTGRPFVAHGVGLSLGGTSARDQDRRRRWLARIALDHAVFDFRWYTDHGGVTAPAGQALGLPLATPMTDEAARAVRRHLEALRAVVPKVGIENSALYYLLGRPEEEPAFLRACVKRPGMHLLLDLHNVVTMAENLGFDAEEHLLRMPLDRVLAIHLAGGLRSDPAWLPAGRTLRLDGHDADVPESVWRLFEIALPRCPRLRGVTLERMEGTVSDADVPALDGELARIRRLVA
jgi:uncharacterized protein (UPF0276 family)